MATQKTITVKDKEYVLQHPGVRNVTKITDRIKNRHGVPSDELLADEMLKYVVVEPKVKMEDFEDYGAMQELVQRSFLFITNQEDPADDADQQAGS